MDGVLVREEEPIPDAAEVMGKLTEVGVPSLGSALNVPPAAADRHLPYSPTVVVDPTADVLSLVEG